MIRTVLLNIGEVINQHFRNEFDSDKMLVLSNLVNSDGGLPENVANKVVFFLIGLSEESTLKNNLNRNRNSSDNSFTKTPKIIHFNLQLLFCANFEGKAYEQGLAYLDSLIRFFQKNRILTVPSQRPDPLKSNPPISNDQERRVSFELCKLDYSELSHLWSAIGGKLKPSALYKVGIVSFDDAPAESIIPSIGEINSKS